MVNEFEQIFKDAIRNVKNWLDERGSYLKTKCSSELPSGYRPELDVSNYCNDEEENYFQQQIGVLRWAIELGRIDITAEVSMLAAPRHGHLQALFHIFSYLSKHDRTKLVFDNGYIKVTDEVEADWTSFYPDAKEHIPTNMQEARGKPVQMICFVDADHAGDQVTRRLRTGVLSYLNRSPILWYSKKQGSVETSTFGSEFVALKTAVDMVMGMRYKLRMIGIPIDGHTHIRVDNMSVVKHTSVPE
jgi:hypothetical protein